MSPEVQHTILWLIPGAPLAAAIIIALLGPKWLGERSRWPCWLALAISAICALLLLANIVPNNWVQAADNGPVGVVASGYSWLDLGQADDGGMQVRIDLRADAISALMLSMVTTVSFLVSVFAGGYMHGDRGYLRFFAAFSLFVF